MKISAVVITLNEERNIGRCIESLQEVCDEIIVLDSFSRDQTIAIAEHYGAIVHQRLWEGYSSAKNFANSLTSGTHILSIDADEALDEVLKKSILGVKSHPVQDQLYEVNRLTNYCGKWIYHSGWYPDWKIRLFPKSVAKWNQAIVHEELEFTGNMPVKKLKGHLLHYSYYSAKEHRERADHYSMLTAQKHAMNGKKAGVLKPFLSAFGRLFSMYVLKKGFLDGRMGFQIAKISAQSNVLKYRTLRKLNRDGLEG